MTYYEILKVSSDATAETIKNQYKKLIFEFHPDRNPSQAAQENVKIINEAYNVLKDSLRRAEYDAALSFNRSSKHSQGSSEKVLDPIKCSRCDKITAQPRFIVFYYVFSIIIVTYRRTMHGAFCRKCAELTSLKASLITILCGWWGSPYGPLYTIEALFVNFTGGKKPIDVNLSLLAHQAAYFYFQGEREMAYAIAQDARTSFNVGVDPYSSVINEIISKTTQHNSKFISKWKSFRGICWGNLAIILMFITSLYIIFSDHNSIAKNTNYPTASEEDNSNTTSTLFDDESLYRDDSYYDRPLNKPEICEVQEILKARKIYKGKIDGVLGQDTLTGINALLKIEENDPAKIDMMTYISLSVLDPARSLFRKIPKSGEIIDHPNTTAHAPLKVTTPIGDENYYIKLVNEKNKTIVGFYMSANDTKEFDVPFGTYKFRYATGKSWINSNCLFGHDTSYYTSDDKMNFFREGNQAVGQEITLQKVQNGNFETSETNYSDF